MASENQVTNCSPRWLPFKEWLQKHSHLENDSKETEGSGSNVTSTSEGIDRPPSVEQHLQSPHDARLTSMLRDCRTELRLVNNYSRARQEMTIMLAAPGLPLHKAAIIPARHAASLVAALSEPLIEIPVGKLSREMMQSPAQLRPTNEAGHLSLWMLPNEDLSLMWKTEMPTLASSPDTIVMALPEGVVEQSRSVVVWEELARFPANCQSDIQDGPVVTIHMLRGDKSKRSFYIKVREDLSSNLLSQLEQERSIPFANVSGQSFGRLYFYVRQTSDEGIAALGKLKSYLKRPPTLAKRSGVPEKQLKVVADWLRHAEDSNQGQTGDRPGMPSRLRALSTSLLGAGGEASQIQNSRGAFTASISATASAVYQDRRFNVVCPCNISVIVNLSVERGGTGVGLSDEEVTAAAGSAARAVAELESRSVVAALGKQRLDEAIAEHFLDTYKQARAKTKEMRSLERRAEQRKKAAAEAQPLIRKAVESVVTLGKSAPISCKAALQMETLSAGMQHFAGGSSTSSGIETPPLVEEVESVCSTHGSTHGSMPPTPPRGPGSRVTLGNLGQLLQEATPSKPPHSNDILERQDERNTENGQGVTLADLADLVHNLDSFSI